MQQEHNIIEVADFKLESNTESMDKLVKIMKELIKDYTEFSNKRTQERILNNCGGVGVG